MLELTVVAAGVGSAVDRASVVSTIPLLSSVAAIVRLKFFTFESKSIPSKAKLTVHCVGSVYVTLSMLTPLGALLSAKFALSRLSSTNVVPESITFRLLESRFSSASAGDAESEAVIAAVLKLVVVP